jgi:hypothetical protein
LKNCFPLICQTFSICSGGLAADRIFNLAQRTIRLQVLFVYTKIKNRFWKNKPIKTIALEPCKMLNFFWLTRSPKQKPKLFYEKV